MYVLYVLSPVGSCTIILDTTGTTYTFYILEITKGNKKPCHVCGIGPTVAYLVHLKKSQSRLLGKVVRTAVSLLD